MTYAVGVFLLVGYVVSVVPARRCHRDIGSFRRTLWLGYGNRDSWRQGIVVAFCAGGWPSLVVAWVWFHGPTREALAELRTEMRERHQAGP